MLGIKYTRNVSPLTTTTVSTVHGQLHKKVSRKTEIIYRRPLAGFKHCCASIPTESVISRWDLGPLIR